MYAILDIETTGGQYNEEGITEIAIYRFDGHEITDQFISLVNPEIPIQPFVTKLTGINNAMLRSAPKFFEIAKRIIEITDGCILVAHNALFDYRILRTEFTRLGYDYQAHTLCTVELAQKLIPDQESYSLGKLVRALGIPMADRHRASGDAMATFKLFKLLLSKDLKKEIVREMVRTEVEKGIEPKLQDILGTLPSRTGVYYVHGHDGSVIYVGRSRNIKKHVNQHFVGNARISKKITAEVFSVSFEETGTELIAILKEREQIQVLKPQLNRIPRRIFYSYGISTATSENGYTELRIIKTEKGSNAGVFISEQEGKNQLLKFAAAYGLCRKLCGLEAGEGKCSGVDKGECDGACMLSVPSEEYNARVSAFLYKHTLRSGNLIIIDRGRNISERSALLIENNRFQGYAFFDLNHQINNPDILRNILTPLPHDRDALSIIRSYIARHRSIKVISF